MTKNISGVVKSKLFRTNAQTFLTELVDNCTATLKPNGVLEPVANQLSAEL